MSQNILKTRIVLNNLTEAEWLSDAYNSRVPLKGEVCIYSDIRKIKIGDGINTIADLTFANLTPEEIQSLIQASSHTHSNFDVINATTASFTTELLTKLNGISACAEPNQNAFSNVTVGSTTISADSKTDTLTLVAGSNVTLTADATNDKITISSTNTDTKVTQTAVTSSDYTNWRPLIWGASNSDTEGFTPTTVTDSTFTANTISCQPSSGTIRASVFKGNLSGNATTASKWATPRTLSLTGAVTGSGTFDGSGDLSISTNVSHTHNYAASSSAGGAANYLSAQHGDEINFIGISSVTELWFNYRNEDNNSVSGNTAITKYKFGNKNGSTSGVILVADTFTGNATSATKATQDASGNVITSKYVAVDTTQTIYGTKTFSNPVNITNTNTSFNTSSGALKVTGGVGVQGQISANTISIGDGVRLEYSVSTQTLNFIFEDTSTSQILTTASDVELTNNKGEILIT